MQNFMITLLTCSVTMSALALIYMAVSPVLASRYSEKARYYAWLVIVIGLIIPFRPQWDNAIIKVEIPSEATAPVAQIANDMFVVTPITMPIENVMPIQVAPNIPWWQITAAIWLAGAVVFLAHHAIKHYRFVKMAVRWSEEITDEQVLALLQSLKTEMEISKQIGLYQCSCAGSPMIIGLINPRIFLPTEEFAHDKLRFILKHELVHHKRKDLLYKYFVLLATAIHWFNPAVYLMAKMIDALCEISCDAQVVQDTDADTRQHYSETIIGVAKYQSKLKTVLSTNFYGGKEGMKKRIFSIMDTGKKKTGVIVVCIVLVATIGTGFAFAADKGTSNLSSSAVLIEPEMLIYQNQVAPSMAVAIKPYEHLGVSIDMASGLMMYEGRPVREIWDSVTETLITESIGPNGFGPRNISGAVDLTAVYEYGVLVGLKVSTQKEYDIRTEQRRSLQGLTAHGGDGSITYSSGTGETASQRAERFEVYREFGLTYDQAADRLYFNGELVRYFEDMIPIGQGASYGIQHFTESGTVDVHAVRDLSQAIQNPDGTVDHSGKLLGLNKSSQAEFNARDIASLRNSNLQGNVAFHSNGAENSLNLGGESGFSYNEAVAITLENGGVQVSSAKAITVSEIFAEFADFGITFDGNIDSGGFGNIYYQGQLVVTLIDDTAEHFLTVSSSDLSGSINVRILRDGNETVTGIEVLPLR